MIDNSSDHTLEFLLAFDGRVHHLERLVGFDNAHGVDAPGSRFKNRLPATDHWHRTESDPGKPYAFKDADTLLQDFFREVRRVLDERGISETVVRVDERRTT